MRYNITGGKLVFAVAILIGGYYSYDALMPPSIWGDDSDENYITITGKKPIDAKVFALVKWGGAIEECSAKKPPLFRGRYASSYSSPLTKVFHDFSKNPTHYELRLPYITEQNSGCKVGFQDLSVGASNVDRGFPLLRIYQSGNDYDDKPNPIDSLIEARNCGSLYVEYSKEWSEALACDFYINGKTENEERATNRKRSLGVPNSYTTHFNFEEFTDKTVLHYGILAGKEYRTEPFLKKKK